jgi:hypothetical protein
LDVGISIKFPVDFIEHIVESVANLSLLSFEKNFLTVTLIGTMILSPSLAINFRMEKLATKSTKMAFHVLSKSTTVTTRFLLVGIIRNLRFLDTQRFPQEKKNEKN